MVWQWVTTSKLGANPVVHCRFSDESWSLSGRLIQMSLVLVVVMFG